jgi:hypothetical protein
MGAAFAQWKSVRKETKRTKTPGSLPILVQQKCINYIMWHFEAMPNTYKNCKAKALKGYKGLGLLLT